VNQTYSCGNCGAPIAYGQGFCINCGMRLLWGTQQMTPPPFGYQYPNPQQMWGQQQPQYNQQFNFGGNRGAVPQQKKTSTGITLMIVTVFLVFTFVGIALVTNGEFFTDLSGNQSGDVPPASSTPPQTLSPAVTSPPATSPVVTSFKANPSAITEGQTAMLSWDISGATSVSIDQGIGDIALYGTREVSPAVNTTYTITASNVADSVTASATITVAPTVPPVISDFTASPNSIKAGQSATLQWNITRASSAAIDQGIGNVSASGTQTVSPTATTTYTLTANNDIGSVTATATITVTGVVVRAPVINHFTASPATVDLGQPSVLSWDISGATSISISGLGVFPLVASPIVYPSVTTTYTLTATNSAGSVTASTMVTVNQ
jgi:hypothetical protein